MKTYYVLWTYIANYSRLMQVVASDAAHAHHLTADGMSEDFRLKATVFVFDTPPAHIVHKGVQMEDFDAYRDASRKG